MKTPLDTYLLLHEDRFEAFGAKRVSNVEKNHNSKT
jgi:hypothetical protein